MRNDRREALQRGHAIRETICPTGVDDPTGIHRQPLAVEKFARRQNVRPVDRVDVLLATKEIVVLRGQSGAAVRRFECGFAGGHLAEDVSGFFRRGVGAGKKDVLLGSHRKLIQAGLVDLDSHVIGRAGVGRGLVTDRGRILGGQDKRHGGKTCRAERAATCPAGHGLKRVRGIGVMKHQRDAASGRGRVAVVGRLDEKLRRRRAYCKERGLADARSLIELADLRHLNGHTKPGDRHGGRHGWQIALGVEQPKPGECKRQNGEVNQGSAKEFFHVSSR